MISENQNRPADKILFLICSCALDVARDLLTRHSRHTPAHQLKTHQLSTQKHTSSADRRLTRAPAKQAKQPQSTTKQMADGIGDLHRKDTTGPSCEVSTHLLGKPKKTQRFAGFFWVYLVRQEAKNCPYVSSPKSKRVHRTS